MENIIADDIGVKNPKNKQAKGKQKKGRKGDFQNAYTNNQWYCFQAKQMVFFTAFSNESPNKDDLIKMAKRLIRLAPQLGSGFDGAIDNEPLSEKILAQISDVEQVDGFDKYPQKWDVSGDDVFASPNLPFFRIKAVVRNKGADERGRASMIMIISTHALIEGADSSLLSRSRAATKDDIIVKPKGTPKIKIFGFNCLATILAPLQLIGAQFLVPKKVDANYRALSIEREKIKRVCDNLGVSQRALIFALALFALNDGGKGFSKKSISSIYADMNDSGQFQTNDDFFRFRMVDIKLKVTSDFLSFVKNVDEAIKLIESSNTTKTQNLLNAIFGMHRRFKNALPFLYRGRVFRFNGGYDVSLSLLPPQRLFGGITKGMMEPIYAGTFHPGMNMCVFAPGRTQVTFNFSLQKRHLKNVDKIENLLDEIDSE